MDFTELMRMATQMREQLANAQREAGDLRVTGDSGAGLVRVEMNGRYEVLQIKVDPKAVDPNEVGLLEDLLRAAINQASARVAERLRHNVGHLAGQLGLDLNGLDLSGLGLDGGTPRGRS